MAFKGILYAILAALCFGIMPILTKLLYKDTGIDPFFFLMVRYLLAAILMWIYVLARRDYSWKEIRWNGFSLIGLTSCCYIIVTAAYFIALKYVAASLNSLLVFTFPLFLPFLGLLFFKEKLRWFSLLAALLGFIGCGMVIGGYQLHGYPGETYGIILGLVSGVIYALYTLFGQKVTVTITPLIATTINVSLVALFFVSLRITWFWNNPQPLKVYWVAGVIAVISTILANVFYFKVIKMVGAVKAGIFSSFEPFFTTVLAIFFLSERMSVLQWLGAVLIFGGMIVVQQPWQKPLIGQRTLVD